jgi:hypothetical protein
MCEGKKIARLASGFVFLLAIPEFYSHLASWRVVIRTPGYCVQMLHRIKCTKHVKLQPSSVCCKLNSPHSGLRASVCYVR